MRAPFKLRAVALLASIELVSCTGSGAPKPSPTAPPSGFHEHVGSMVLGATQWPECLNPITSCAVSDWTWFTVLHHVLPRAMELGPDGRYRASPLLVGAPSIANGGLQVGPPFRITFHINPRAVWDDGSPITSRDFDFTWRAILGTTGAARPEAYERVVSIDAQQPKVVVLSLSLPYSNWPEIFGGPFGFVLKANAFPQFSFEPHPDLKDEMLDQIPFSGGPFVLNSWSKNQAVLRKNVRYFGKLAKQDQVTFIPRIDQSTEINSLQTGEIAAVYFEPNGYSDEGLPALQRTRLVHFESRASPNVEALWFNLTKPPLNDARIREALMYAIDREAVIESVVRPYLPGASVLNCGFIAVPGSSTCARAPFERFSFDPKRARSLLENAGYDCGARICTKGGEPLQFDYWAPICGPGLDAANIIDRHAEAAGFDLRFRFPDGRLFACETRLPLPLTQFSVPAWGTDFESLLSCHAIPTDANSYRGQNLLHWCNAEVDQLVSRIDVELDPTRRAQLVEQLFDLEVLDRIGLPLFQPVAVAAWRTDQITGPIGLYAGSPNGLFYNLNEWYVAT